jgi:peroxiredoxin
VLLQTKLDALKAQAESDPNVAPEAATVLKRATADLIRSGIAERALGAGARVPAFALPDSAGNQVDVGTHLARGPLVVSFYRGAWCPYCQLELAALQEAAPDFAALGAGLVAISPNLPAYARQTVRTLGLTFPVLIDRGNAVARRFGLVWQFPDDLRAVYHGFGVDLSQVNGDDSWELPLSARYVIASDGVIAHAEINPDYTHLPDPRQTIAELKKLPTRPTGAVWSGPDRAPTPLQH